MGIKKISLMKQYQRLFDGPIDSSAFHESMSDFMKYINGETNMVPYSGQICAIKTQSIPNEEFEFYYIFKNGDNTFKYQKLGECINYKQTLLPVFCIGSVEENGIGDASNVLKIPYTGILNNIDVVSSKTGTGDLIIDILKISSDDYKNNKNNWVSIFTMDNKLTVKEGSLFNEPDYIINDNIITKDDLLKVSLIKIGTGYETLTINLNIECVIK